MFAGDLDGAAERLAEARDAGAAVDAKTLWYADTLTGDLAVLNGRPREAFEPYVRSLEAAQARGDQLQIFHDLGSVANALALVEADADALEVAGLAEAQGRDVGRIELGDAVGAAEDLLREALAAAARRVGAATAADLKAHGHAVAPGNRVTVACARARARVAG